jgi:hypothetical protein
VRIRRRSELSSAAAITVIAVTAIGAGKLRSSATSWSSAAPTAQTSTAAAAQSIARRTISRAFARTPAMPVSHAAFAFCLMTMAAIVPPPLLTMTSYAERASRCGGSSHLADAVAVSFPTRLGRTPSGLNADESYQRGAPQAALDTAPPGRLRGKTAKEIT